MARDSDDLLVYGLLVAIGIIPVATTLARGVSFGVEATVGLLMVCAGILGAIVPPSRPDA